MKIAVLICLFFCSCFSLIAQSHEGKTLVKWDADNKINWHNFPVKDTNDRYAAESNTFFKANFYLKNDSVFCQVITYLNADRSWRKPNLQTDGEYAINHEQKHFDITEIFARKIRKELIHNSANELQVKKIYFDYAKSCRDFQQLYDNETKHSLDKKKQDRWNKKIQSLLLALDAYKEQPIYVKNPWCKNCWKDAPIIAMTNSTWKPLH